MTDEIAEEKAVKERRDWGIALRKLSRLARSDKIYFDKLW
jgi:hypothetical protein